jgi:hypothetical protein
MRTKHNKVRISCTTVGILAMLASTAVFAKGSGECECGEPDFVDEGRSLSLKAELGGLDDNCDVHVSLTAFATVDLACIDPSGDEQQWAEPENLEILLTDSKTYSRQRIENGRLEINLRTDEMAEEILGAPDCPECGCEEWTEDTKSVRFTEATLLVRQIGKEPLKLLCSFDSPTKNGKISGSDVSCERL